MYNQTNNSFIFYINSTENIYYDILITVSDNETTTSETYIIGLEIPPPEPTSSSSGGSSSGGGGGGSSSNKKEIIIEEKECSKEWICASWSECDNNKQRRECINECGEALNDVKNCKSEIIEEKSRTPSQITGKAIEDNLEFNFKNLPIIAGGAFIIIITLCYFKIKR